MLMERGGVGDESAAVVLAEKAALVRQQKQKKRAEKTKN
jgi:hypothetical protein